MQVPSVVGCGGISHYLTQLLPYESSTTNISPTARYVYVDGNVNLTFKVIAVNAENISSTASVRWTSRTIGMILLL